MPPELKNPVEVESAFYEAFRTLDLDLMARLWSEKSATYCVHPGGQVLVGTQEILRGWLEIFDSADPPRIAHRNLNHYRSHDLAVHLVEERISPKGSRSDPSLVMATNTYKEEDGLWTMIGHHASLPMMVRGGRRPDKESLH